MVDEKDSYVQNIHLYNERHSSALHHKRYDWNCECAIDASKPNDRVVAREAFRKACLSKTTDKRWPQVINLLWCVFPLGVILSFVLGYVWLYHLEIPDPVKIPNYPLAVLVFAASGSLELLSEQLWVVAQAFVFLRLKVVIEGIANFGRCVITLGLVLFVPDLGIITFCIAQMAFSILAMVLYYLYFIYYIQTAAKQQGTTENDFPLKSIRDFFPKTVTGKSFVSWGLARLTWSFFKQSFLKKILTEGERYIMTLFKVLTFSQQGIYDVINNLGSLVARCVFMPIEESYYTFFAHTLERGSSADQQTQQSAKVASETLEVVLKFVVLVGLTFLVFGYSYSFLLLDMYGGTTLSSGEGPSLLQWYCVYVLIIAVNGMTECFMFAAMSKDDVDSYNYKMMVFSVVFLGASWYLTVLGSVGFVIANCLNMLLRIYHSLIFIHNYFKSAPHLKPLRGLVPSPLVLLSFAVSWVITVTSEARLCCSHGWFYRILHIGIGGVCLLVVAALVYIKEKTLVNFMLEHWLGRRKRKEE
ncbi:Oligosaccharide translocation protein rft1 [Desmophyllum pertusum]|uniref:Protein RFT1 homolog n=1 Tax=Desmophyllum pertusum TaxID=174260 RepID=A0A9X0A2X9_9CNID|nr:Oligosaccharide translocation protein rft1 [Desmophyllum pertusum]